MTAKILNLEEYRIKKLRNQLFDEASILAQYVNLQDLQNTLIMLKDDLQKCESGYKNVLKEEIELIKLAVEIAKK